MAYTHASSECMLCMQLVYVFGEVMECVSHRMVYFTELMSKIWLSIDPS